MSFACIMFMTFRVKRFIWIFDCCCRRGVASMAWLTACTFVTSRLISAISPAWDCPLGSLTSVPRTVCHSWPGFENSYKKWVTLKWNKLHLFRTFRGKSPFGYWPTNLPSHWLVASWGIRTASPLKPAQWQWLPLDAVFCHCLTPPDTESLQLCKSYVEGCHTTPMELNFCWL